MIMNNHLNSEKNIWIIMHYIAAGIFLLIVGFLSGCRSSGTESESVAKDEDETPKTTITLTVSRLKAIGVKTVPVEIHDIGTPVKLPGHVEPVPEQDAYVTSLIAGRIEKVLVHAGDLVKAGQPLVNVTGSELGSYFANLRNTFVELDRQDRLAKRSVGIPRKLQDARIAFAAARQQLLTIGFPAQQVDHLAQSEQDIAELTLPAPINGVVLELNAVQGGPVFPGDKLLRIVGLKPIWVEADVFEKDLDHLKPGLPVWVIPAAATDIRYEGTILKIVPKIDYEQRTARAIIKLPNENEELKPGMYVTAEVITTLEKINAVPSMAVQIDGELFFVLIADNDSTFRRLQIKARPEGSKYIPIPEVSLGTRVVTTGAFQIMSAMKGVKAESE